MDSSVATRAERWVLAATILASSMAFIDGSALNVALPSIQTSLGATGAGLLWVVNAYLIMLAALILVGGALGDRFGRKRVFAAGIALFSAASCACGFSPSLGFLVVARLVQGLGGALMIPGSLSLIRVMVAEERRGKAIGTWSAVTTLVTIAGPLLGGFLSDQGLWRGVFLINLPLGVASLAILWTRVAERPEEDVRRRLDAPGALLAVIALGAIAYGAIAAPERGLGDPRVYLSLAAGVLAAFAFVLVETRSPAPMLPMSIFSSRRFGGANLLTLLLYGALGAATFFISLDLIQAQSYTKTEAGMAFLPFALLLTFLSPPAGALADRIGPRPLLVAGPALSGSGFLLMAFAGLTAGPAEYWTRFLPGMILLGLGMGLTVAPLSSTVMGAVDARSAGLASGINNAAARAAGVLAIAVIGALALSIFGRELARNSRALAIDPAARSALVEEAGNFGAASVPAAIPLSSAPAAELAIKNSFSSAFRVVMLLCAALAWLSSLSAALMIGARAQSSARN